VRRRVKLGGFGFMDSMLSLRVFKVYWMVELVWVDFY
jgi:hypothetical protein